MDLMQVVEGGSGSGEAARLCKAGCGIWSDAAMAVQFKMEQVCFI